MAPGIFKRMECLNLQGMYFKNVQNILLGLLDTEGDGTRFLWNVGNHSPSDISHPRSPPSSVFDPSTHPNTALSVTTKGVKRNVKTLRIAEMGSWNLQTKRQKKG
jgi:hypothetical protein